MRNKKALSTVVTSLIMILLVLVAIGIVWVVIRGIIQSGTSQVDILSNCNLVSVVPISAISNLTATNTTVVLKRESMASSTEIGGVKMVFSLEDGTIGTKIVDVPKDTINKFEVLGTYPITTTFTAAGISPTTTNDLKEVTVYFLDANTGEKKNCPSSESFNF